MKKKIFLDTIVVVDWIGKPNARQFISKKILQKIRLHAKPWISPTTLAVVCYFLEKKFFDKKVLMQKSEAIIRNFNFTAEDHAIVNQIIGSGFTDVEDALQYFSAVNSNIDLIITWNVKDYGKSKIPVVHPLHFLQLV